MGLRLKTGPISKHLAYLVYKSFYSTLWRYFEKDDLKLCLSWTIFPSSYINLIASA
jgi:hypothetical protein